MGEWQLKRFWKDVSVLEKPEGFALTLDGKPVMTPFKSALTFPTRALADAAASEWEAQQDKVQPDAMPITRAGNSAIDKVAPQRPAVEEMLLEYAETDLVCYRAETPQDLVARQTELWDPCLDWIEDHLGVRMLAVTGVMYFPQPGQVRPAFERQLAQYSDFELTALHDLVVLPGSLVLGLAVAEDHLAPAEAWTLARLDEEWQSEFWGKDAEAEAKAMSRFRDFEAAATFLRLCRSENTR
ncbi:ATP12 family chaperone protein [Algicella marina]|uniref:ATPase n=1 Tax=Algicella marina TaxID=2683284 RepID=A0A6P1STS8_9RHOB|nr:ATP12 family protein [Algicella marina]QHQ33828.1 ATPase [Algicella marina]